MYKIEYVDEDKRVLKYKDKELEFTKDVELASKFQELPKRTKTRMIVDLAKQGISINDLVIKTQKDGKTIEDHSSEDAIYKMYQGEEMLKILDEICTKYFNMTVVELVKDMELTQEQELKFGGDLMVALIGKQESPKESQ
jgi:hypothetical protein